MKTASVNFIFNIKPVFRFIWFIEDEGENEQANMNMRALNKQFSEICNFYSEAVQDFAVMEVQQVK